MSEAEIYKIVASADFVVAGYAFRRKEDGNVSIVHIEAPYHAAVIDIDGNVLETNMHDIEMEIVLNKYWSANKHLLIDQRYA